MNWIFVLCLVAAVVSGDSIFNKAVLTTTQGLCLDGSPAAHFISEGTGANKQKFLLYFEGGLACEGEDLAQTLQSCYRKLQTNQGSSKYLPDSFDGRLAGILSGDPTLNPTFHDWTRIAFLYCDGSMFQGHRTQPISYKGANLYFRGQNITQQRFNWLNTKYSLNALATQIVLSGSEDGAIGALQWGNHLQQNVKGKVRVIADSGIMLDVPNPTTKVHYFEQVYSQLAKVVNLQVPNPNLNCSAKFPNNREKCLFFENQYTSLNVPLFTIDTLYDERSFSYSLGIDCVDSFGSLKLCNSTQLAQIEAYKTQVYNMFQKVASIPGNGAWAPACVYYGMITGSIWTNAKYQVPAGSIYTCANALGRWMNNVTEPENHKHIDSVSWPNNRPCSGLDNGLRFE